MRLSLTKRILPVVLLASQAQAGLILYGMCQTVCNTQAMACYATAGAVFGTVVAAPAVPAIIIACNVALGTCMAGFCAPLLLIPCF